MRQVSFAQQLPPHVQRTAAAYQLGTPQNVYEPGKVPHLYRLLAFCGLALGCIILLLFFITYDALFSWWALWQAALIPLVAVAWLTFGTWILLSSSMSPRLYAFVYAEGLVYAKGRAEVILWSQMERIWKETSKNGKGIVWHSCTVRRSDNTLFVFTNEMRDIAALGTRLENEITSRLLPRAMAAYRAGGPVAFDEIVVSTRGIGVKPGHKLLTWDVFECLELDEKAVTIYKKGVRGAWATIKAARVPNSAVLKALVISIRREFAYRQMPHIVAYNAGLTVTFGRLRISVQGIDINNGKNMLPWSEIAGIGVGEDEVMLKRKYGDPEKIEWYALPLWMVPDVKALEELVAYILHGKG